MCTMDLSGIHGYIPKTDAIFFRSNPSTAQSLVFFKRPHLLHHSASKSSRSAQTFDITSAIKAGLIQSVTAKRSGGAI